MKQKRHARRRRWSLRHLLRNRVIVTWPGRHERPEYRMGRQRGRYYIERRCLHYPGLAGLGTERHTVNKAEALAFEPQQWQEAV